MNRLKDFFGEGQEPEQEGDFYSIESRFDTFVVSRATAREVEALPDRPAPPRWIVFHDLAGARHRILTRLIAHIAESTTAQRAARRAFYRARRQEDKADRRPWEDDD